LENFMSYEYARVPFRTGVNIIVGPNGSGKSSLLLAISVALGQTYTERSRKLSDLIRRGKDQGRVTIILDNSPQGGKRPVAKYNKDQIFLTRDLRRDGKYGFELENRVATKQDVERLLGRFGVDPNNMLIIMHQNMVEQFTVLSNVEKLRMVEAAVGLEPFRENVLQAQRKLTHILSQEESVGKLFESAEQTLNYWREQYSKFQEKKQLQTQRRFLDREIAWAEVEKRENTVKSLEAGKRQKQELLNRFEDQKKKTEDLLYTREEERKKTKDSQIKAFEDRLVLEQEIAKSEITIALCQDLLTETALLDPASLKGTNFKILKRENLKQKLANAHQSFNEAKERATEKQKTMQNLENAADKATSQILENRIELALLKYRMDNALFDLKELENSLKEAKSNVETSYAKAALTGPRIAVIKSVSEIMDKIRLTDGHLAALADVSEDIERMYESYSKLYIELKEKAQVVAENREKTLEEVRVRMQAWRNVMQSLLERVNLQYQKILSETLAAGEVRLANAEDIESAGLEIMVGFKGGRPVALDAYTQSGGERTTATMSFLLALQQHVRSPFRAVDEYDIHMDPKNREMIARMLVSTIKNSSTQYVVITPSQVTFAEKDSNIITVQNVEGKSLVREVA
jgi:structural maintenance of chromosomes protein 5